MTRFRRDRISSVAATMLQSYVPRPNQMSGMGMTMNGQPTVVGSGNDSNNYLDVRNEQHFTDQGTVRVDQTSAGEPAFTLQAQGEHGFMPQNLPGFGYSTIIWRNRVFWVEHVLSASMLNIASVAIFGLTMNHHDGECNKNDS